ncbi:MAG: peptide chain release factor N(5)-glutamine methyltransferase [Planctomycetota bacterium]|jgi:release factor glutamine methyltransferase
MSDSGSTPTEAWTILRMLQWTTEHLKKHGSPSARLDAEVLFAHARKCQRIDLYAAFNEEPPEEVKAIFRDLVKRRASGEPVAYLVGKKEFFSLPFIVNQACLIPRNETEHIITECIDRIKKSQGPLRIADVCTGSGCIAITIAKECQRMNVPASVIAVDLSPEALEIAKQNLELHKVQDRVEMIQADLLEAIPDESCDFILSNPPYVSEEEYSKLDKSVRNYEPKMALVAGNSGTEIIQRLVDQAALKLKPSGWLIFEHSPMNAAKCLEILSQSQTPSGPWADLRTVKDLSGLARVTIARRP